MFWSRNENCNQQARTRRALNLLKTIPGNKLLLDHYLDGAIEGRCNLMMVKMYYIIGIIAYRTLSEYTWR
jgi:carbamoyl-phosphate synthase large subunit